MKIGAYLVDDQVEVKPISFLENNFQTYLEAIRRAGGRYLPEKKLHQFMPTALPRLQQELESCGFEIVFDSLLCHQLAATADHLREAEERCRERVDRFELEAFREVRPYQRIGALFLALRKKAGLFDEQGLGKQQPIDTRVLTPTGWREIGTLRVGDRVIGSQGRAVSVIGVFPQGVKPSYRVRFSDHSSVEAGPEHLWTVAYRKGGRVWTNMVVTTDQLRQRPKIGSMDLSKTNLYLPLLSAPVEFDPADPLPIPPYFFGQLVANGSLADSSVTLTCHEQDWPEIQRSLEAEQVRFGATHVYGKARRVICLGAVTQIRALNFALRSAQKYIPKIFMQASVPDRIALLQGLMDGDGSVSQDRNRVTYHTISEQLARDVQELIEGLGGIASIQTYDRRAQEKGIEHRIRIRMPASIAPFRLTRKAARYTPSPNTQPCRVVLSVTFVRDEESVCIAVDAPDHLYVTEHAILTHNTVQAALAVPDNPIPPVLVVCPAIGKGVWEREFRLWRPDFMAPVILEGRSSFRWPKGGEIVILNYDILPAEVPPGVIEGTIVIGDEAHHLRNRRTARSVRFTALGEAARKKNGATWLLTGTPLQSRPPELWDVLSAADLAIPTYGSWGRFRELFGGYEGRHGIEWDNTPDEAAVDALKKNTLRRSRDEVLKELPPATYETIKVELDAQAAKADKNFELALSEMNLTIAEAIKQARSRDGNKMLSQLSQLRELFAIAKIPTMLRIVEEHEAQDTPLVVFSAHRAPIEALQNRPGWRVIMGGTPSSERTETENLFQAGKLKGVAGTIGAMATAITLTRGNHELFIDRDWVPANNEQAEDRLRRIGQLKSVVITDLVAKSKTDKMLYSILATKKMLVNATIKASARGEGERPDDLARDLEHLLQKATVKPEE